VRQKGKTYQGKPCKRGHVGTRRVKGGDCVDCVKERSRERWAKDPAFKEKWLARRREAYATEGGRKYRKEHNLRSNYGLTIEAYDDMRQMQRFMCEICDREEWEVGQLVVDHDHSTGRVRALLCMTCNLALGGLRDDPVIAENAARYLRKHCRL
jgi:Recombination endonuclease VII